MTQKQRILYELREAGSMGIRSDHFFSLGLPRAAARIGELKAEGHEISTEHVHPFVIYRLAGVGAGGTKGPGNAGLAGNDPLTSPDSGEHVGLGAGPGEDTREECFLDAPTCGGASAESSGPTPLFEDPTPPAYDPWDRAA